MNEFIFVLKSLAATAVIVMMMQVKVGGVSVEERTTIFLEKSQISVYLQSVAAGGALAMTNFAKQVKQSLASTVDSYREGADQQKASK